MIRRVLEVTEMGDQVEVRFTILKFPRGRDLIVAFQLTKDEAGQLRSMLDEYAHDYVA